MDSQRALYQMEPEKHRQKEEQKEITLLELYMMAKGLKRK